MLRESLLLPDRGRCAPLNVPLVPFNALMPARATSFELSEETRRDLEDYTTAIILGLAPPPDSEVQAILQARKKHEREVRARPWAHRPTFNCWCCAPLFLPDPERTP